MKLQFATLLLLLGSLAGAQSTENGPIWGNVISPTNGQTLTYNASLGLWQNQVASSNILLPQPLALSGATGTIQSSSLMTLQVSSAAADRYTALTGVAGGFEGGIAQEPSTFWNPVAGNWGMVYTGSTGVGYATAPSWRGPWTRQGKILGGGTGGFSGNVTHVRAFISGGLIYICFPNFGTNTFMITNGAAMPAANAAPVFTSNSSLLYVGALGITSGLLGNSNIVQAGSTYYLYWEAFQTGVGWQMGVATSSTMSGTYTEQLFPITSLRPATTSEYATTPGGPRPFYENGTFVMYYHAGPNTSGSSNIYRAFSTTPTTDSWTIDNNGAPWINRQLPNETSQVADIDVTIGPSGGYYAFWSAVNNNMDTQQLAGASSINGTAVIEPLYGWESGGSLWRPLLTLPDTSPPEFEWNGTLYTANTTLGNNQMGAFDPNAASSNLIATLPYADTFSRVRVCNGSYIGSYTVSVAAQSGDAITAGSPTLGDGECATFRASTVNIWMRDFGVSRNGTTNFAASSVQNFNGTVQMLNGSYFVAYSGANVQMLAGSTFYSQPVAIASLQTCNSGNAGIYNTVNNGVASPTYMGVVSATGSATDPVFCNGANWVYH